MPYEILATSKTPALIIFVLDISASMSLEMAGKPRINWVTDAFAAALRRMVMLSTKGTRVASRYQLAMYAYSDEVYDLLGGIKSVEQVAKLGVPELDVVRATDTAKAFQQVEAKLETELPKMSHCPAPLVCHLTDGEYTGDDPEPIAKRIMSMKVPDGNVLLENVFISDRVLSSPISNVKQWKGVQKNTKLNGDYAQKLRNMSSTLPVNYQIMMRESGYSIDPKALMMLPGDSPELVEMGFVMATATKVV